MKHPWERLHDLINTLGLILGAIGIIIIGWQLDNVWILLVAIISLLCFVSFFFILLFLFIRDYKKLYPRLKNCFLILKY